ncbi:helix-turn-helix domain-containing protein [Brucella rhizosphaerae]|uniref:helix-turn-helix domain-containing protein n=1 Tax=Brucella rhizosphaerae TaxID=571254 RepID=UPI000463A37E|nr:helix-turn-helix transcriptional regulator [Brucella rhizosphaerae]
MAITAEQLRAARALLKMEQRALAELASVNIQTLKRYEGGSGVLSGNYQNIEALINVLTQAGVQFLEDGQVASGAGVALKGQS